MVKRILLYIFVLTSLTGCVSTKIPKYLSDEEPYVKKFYTDFDATLSASQKALRELGWDIVDTADPGIYERTQNISDSAKQVLLFTDIRQTALFLGSRYHKLNVYIRDMGDSSTDVEVRYITVNSLPFRSYETYKNESAANRILNLITKILEQG